MKTMTAKEVQQVLDSRENYKLIDVREVDEVAAGHIPGVIHIPLGLLEFKKQDLSKNEKYIIICRSGGRSAQATAYLESYGFDVTNMTGGMLEWTGEIE